MSVGIRKFRRHRVVLLRRRGQSNFNSNIRYNVKGGGQECPPHKKAFEHNTKGG